MKQLTRVLLIAVITTTSSLLALGQGQSQNADIAEAVKAMTKAEWAAEIRDPSSVAEQSKNYAEDYTEFRPEYPTRLEGKDVYMRINTAGATGNSRSISAEMFNPKVQVYNGDVAILSYHYVGINKDKDGKTETTRVKVTRVYVKRDGKWMLVHKNVGSDPLPK
jgi:ketosteroid isomerase-like protein